MRYRTLGNTGLQVSELGLGANQIGRPQISEQTAEAVLRGAVDRGINLIDTAAMYKLSEERIGRYLAECYSAAGARAFDHRFMGEDVYDRAFSVVVCDPAKVPEERESGKPLGRHLDGCRIGFDLGASDRKASAVIDGKAVFSEEVVWEPRIHADPEYHYREIMSALEAAASRNRPPLIRLEAPCSQGP